MNKAILIGNLGADPELRHTKDKTAVLNIRLATSESYKDKNTNEKKDVVEWHRIVVWGNRAEALSKFLSKGDRIAIEGSIHTTSYENKDGVKTYTTEIKASDVELLGGKKKEAQAAE